MDAQLSRPMNQLLTRLQPTAYDRVAPHLTLTALHSQQVLYRPGESISEIYFPESSVICLMTVMENGATLETATVGPEGASWISAVIGAPSMPCETIVAVGGEAYVLGIRDLDREMQENPYFRDVLTKYSHALLIHSMRMTGCTGLHSLPQRCARWILEATDRVGEDRFEITHSFLATLLGTHRPSVSIVIEDFVTRGLLRVERGRVFVHDRNALRTSACECYEIIKENYAHFYLKLENHSAVAPAIGT